jgi:VWFA-related protein
MRKFTALVLLLSLCVLPSENFFAQSRARRVGQTPPQPAPAPSKSAPTAPQGNRPAAAPPSQSTIGGGARPPAPEAVSEEVGDDDVVRVNTALVTIPVSIMDRDGRFIPNLRKEDFRIFEDGVEQQVAYFATVEQPFTVALVLDTSGSTKFKMQEMQDAAISFVDQLRPEDRVLVVSFDDRIQFLSDATSDRGALRNAIRRTHTGGGTKLYDAVDMVIKQHLNRIKGRKAIVLFTDGVDTTSKRASYRSNVEDAEELDALVYPIQYDTYEDQPQTAGTNWPGQRRPNVGDILSVIIGGGVSGRGIPGGRGGRGGGGVGTSREEYQRGGEYLREMAAKTGGRHYQADDLRYLEQAFTNIAEELRRQYSLGYYPARQSQASERRQLKVRVKRPNLVVRARDSYIYKPSGGGASVINAKEDDANGRTAPGLRRQNFAN